MASPLLIATVASACYTRDSSLADALLALPPSPALPHPVAARAACAALARHASRRPCAASLRRQVVALQAVLRLSGPKPNPQALASGSALHCMV